MGQVFILGIVFLFVFSAYITIQAFASKLYGDMLGSNSTLGHAEHPTGPMTGSEPPVEIANSGPKAPTFPERDK